MHIYGTQTIADVLGDNVAFRNIRPVDTRLPSLHELAPNTQPRKGDTAYAQVAITILKAAQQLRQAAPIEQFFLVGDTRQSDGGTYTAIAKASGWQGAAFICDEKRSEDPQFAASNEHGIYTANRWRNIESFAQQYEVGPTTAIIIDLDKTFIGARGRNHQMIDEARLTALQKSVIDVLGTHYDAELFENTYHRFNQPRFHRFTGDNQDFLAFVCIMAGGRIVTPEALQAMLEQGVMRDFEHFVDLTGARIESFASPLLAFHQDFATRYHAGDMTPFKEFRYLEYTETAARFGCAPDDMEALDMLAREIVITGEVWQVAKQWQQQGALLFGLSDKPDEAACGDGSGPCIHRLPTHVIGS